MKYIKVNIIFIFFAFNSISQNSRILFHNATVHTGLGNILKNTSVGIEGNKIIFIQNIFSFKIDSTKWDNIIDINEKHIYPGFVSSNSTLGLTEIDAIRATNDYNELGKFNPHVRSCIAYNTDSKVLQTVLSNGVMIVQATPRGNTICGQSSIFFSHGWNWEDAVIKQDDGIHVNWPNPLQLKKDSKNNNDFVQNEKYHNECEELEFFFQSALKYSNQKNNENIDLRYESMKGIFQGDKRVYFHANDVKQLLDIITFVKKYNIKFPVYVGAYESYLCLDRIRDSEIPILLPRIHSLPQRDDDAIDLPYKLPYILFQNGIIFGLQNEGDMEAMNTRNLPYLAGTAVAYGLPEEDAIKSISYNVCKILGIEKQFGSIEIGKNASFFVSNGSVLDMKTSQISHLILNGNLIEINDFQSELYKKYLKKYKIE